MGYAVYHMEKGQASSGGIGNHIDRKPGHEHTYQHSDPDRRHLNKNYKVYQDRQNTPLSQAIEERIQEGYKGERAIRKDAVKYKTHILTGSHEDMKRIFSNKETADKWVKENYNFVAQEFGEKNIVRFSLHLDEKTPHIHAVTIPLTQDGRLSAKEIIGNRSVMQARQDRYAEAMRSFGLERGIKNTGIKHENAREFYARINHAQELSKKNEIKAEKGMLGGYKAESVQELEKSVSTLNVALKGKELEGEAKDRRIKETAARNTVLKRGSEKLKNDINILLSDKKVYLQQREKVIEQVKKDIAKEMDKRVRFKFSLKFNSTKERGKFINKSLKEIGEEKKIPPPMINAALKDDAFKEKLVQKVIDNEQNQSRKRGRNL